MKSLSERFLFIQLGLIGIIQSVLAADPTFITPDPDGSTVRSVDENAPKDQSILTIEGQDTDGQTLTFSIVSQIPISPPFELNTTSGLFKTPAGLDAEFSQQYVIRFGVSDGGPTVESADFTVNINDVNEFSPVFSPGSYSKDISVALGTGSSVLTVNATDGDVTATVTRSITAGDTNSLFVINSSTGQIDTSSNALIAGTYTLTVQASDGTNTATATVTIRVGQVPTSRAGSTGNNGWIAAVVLGGILFIVIIICFLRYLRVFTFNKVPFCGESIEKYLKGGERRRTNSDEEAVTPMNTASRNPKVEKEHELENQPPITDDKKDETTDKPKEDSSEKYKINKDEKTPTDITSENDTTENGKLKDTSNAEEKSNFSNIDEKRNDSGTHL